MNQDTIFLIAAGLAIAVGFEKLFGKQVTARTVPAPQSVVPTSGVDIGNQVSLPSVPRRSVLSRQQAQRQAFDSLII